MWKIYSSTFPDFIHPFMSAPAMTRLKDVGMHCGCEYTAFPMFAGLEKYSRFDHSVGCALIVWHFTHDVRQTLAALMHDIATPTFAHVIDFLNGDPIRQESTERGTEAVIKNATELMAALKELGIKLEEVANYHLYPIADNDSPQLSADRLEYTLSNIVNYRIASREATQQWYQDLTVGKNEQGEDELMFCHIDMAEHFSLAALRTSKIYIADEDRYAMQTLATLLKKHLERGIISSHDLYKTEQNVIAKLIQDSESQKDWLQFRALHAIHCITQKKEEEHPSRISLPLQDTEKQGDGLVRPIIIPSKKRFINPCVAGQGRMSDLSSAFADALSMFLAHPLDTPLWGE